MVAIAIYLYNKDLVIIKELKKMKYNENNSTPNSGNSSEICWLC